MSRPRLDTSLNINIITYFDKNSMRVLNKLSYKCFINDICQSVLCHVVT